jgi:hypothetical protein
MHGFGRSSHGRHPGVIRHGVAARMRRRLSIHGDRAMIALPTQPSPRVAALLEKNPRGVKS